MYLLTNKMWLCVLTSCVFLSGVIIGAKALTSSNEEVTSVETHYLSKGIEAFKKKQYDTAQDWFEKELAIDPSSPKVNFYLAKISEKKGKYSKAILIYERMLLIDPENVDIQIHIGRNYMSMGNTDKARDIFEVILEENLPEETQASLEYYLSEINKVSRNFFSGALILGQQLESNASLGTGPLPLIEGSSLFSDPTTQSDRIFSGIFLLNHGYVFNQNKQLGVKNQLLLYTSNYNHLGNLDTKLVQLLSTLEYTYNKHRYGLGIGITEIWLHEDLYQINKGIRGSYSYSLNSKISCMFLANAYKNHYFQVTVPDANNFTGTSNNVQGSLFYMYDPKTVLILSLQHDFNKSPSNGSESVAYHRYLSKLAVNRELLKDLSLSVSTTYRQDRYNNFDVMRTTLKRRDKTSIVDLSLNYKLNSSISIGINGNYMDNNSNLATSTYINKKASLTLTYLF